MSKENTSLTTTSSTALEPSADVPPDQFEEAAVHLHKAIDEDKRSIESHLAVLQVELERGMEQVAETRDKALDLKEDVSDRLEHIKARFARVKDWKGVVRDYPWQTVGVSMAIGFYLGSMLRD